MVKEDEGFGTLGIFLHGTTGYKIEAISAPNAINSDEITFPLNRINKHMKRMYINFLLRAQQGNTRAYDK